MRRLAILFLLGAMALPSLAAKRANVEQLRQMLSAPTAKTDGDQAWQIGDVQPTERISAANLAILSKLAMGEKSRKALIAVADESQFLDPPASELPTRGSPDIATQRQIMGLVASYVSKTIPKLPNFFATRVTTRFEDTPLLQLPGDFIPFEPMHPVGASSETVLYRDGREVVDTGETKVKQSRPMVQGLTTWGVFGPVLGTVLVDAAQSKLGWGHWEQGAHGLEAVFTYAVPKEKSNYAVDFCCTAEESAVVSANVRQFHQITGYHGELVVDPASGTILRLVLEADLKPTDPVVKADILVDYGAVEIGGKTYFCPVKVISIALAQTLQVNPRYKFALANQMQPLKNSLNDVALEEFHVFRAESRVLAENEAGPATNAPAVKAENASTAEAAKASAPAASEPAASLAAAGTSEAAAKPETGGGTEKTARAADEGAASEMLVETATGLPDIEAKQPTAGSNGEFTLRSTSRLVDVNVVAYDKAGHPVTDLKASDFALYDNGAAQQIRFFSQANGAGVQGSDPANGSATNAPGQPVYSNRRTDATAGTQAPSEAPANSTILMIDAGNLAWGDLTYARAEMLRFLKTLPASERVGLYVLRSHDFQVLLEPTPDHLQVDATLRKWMPTAQDLARAQDEEQRNRQHIDWVAHTSDLAYVNGNDGTDPEGSASGAQRTQLAAHGIDPKLRTMGSNPEQGVLQQFEMIAHHLAIIPGHKSLVWISSDNALSDWASQAAGREDKGSKLLDPLAMHAREALNEAHVSIYPLDASQLEAGVITADLENRLVQVRSPSLADPSAPPPNPTGRYAAEMHQDTHAIQGAFRDLAEATGGRALRRAGDIAAELNGIVGDGKAAYLLSFTPDVPPDDIYHRLTLKVTGRPGITLRYRTGYLYEREAATLKERFSRAIWQATDASEIGISATRASGGSALELNIAAADLDLAQQGDLRTDKLDIFLVERNDADAKAKVTGQTLGLRLKPATLEKALKDGIRFEQHLPEKSENGSLRIIVVDENTGRMGSVTVPNEGAMAKP
jgi:VWFA-related protein